MLSVLVWPLRLISVNLYAYLIAPIAWLLSERLGCEISEGAVFRVSVPLKAHVLTHWRTPYTGGFNCTVPVGVRLRAGSSAPAASRGCTFVPHEVADLQRFVPAEERFSAKFSGVSLPLSSTKIRRHLCRLQAVV